MTTAMITATAWVPRGFAAQFPTRREFDEGEFERIVGLARGQLDDARDALSQVDTTCETEANGLEMDVDEEGGVKIEEHVEQEKKGKGGKKREKRKGEEIGDGRSEEEGVKTTEVDDDDLREYDLDNYDDSDEAVDSDGEPMGMFGGIKSLAYHQNGEDDPYITIKEGDEEEKDELQILGTDNLLLVAKSEDEIAQLEVYVYEDEADNLYIHHDFMLPAIPLCVEWLDVPVHQQSTNKLASPPLDRDSRGNFCAIGTMDPDIEIWDLDVVDCMFPNAILGAGSHNTTSSLSKKKREKRKAKERNPNYHVDSVLSLAANRAHRNLLASASADQTIKLWDLNTTQCAQSYSHHTDKVCALAWHPQETTVLLSGSYDCTVVTADMRAPKAKAPRWGVGSDVEGVKWDPHDSNYFYVSTENGMVHFHDVRNAPTSLSQAKAVWVLQAHDKACSAMNINPVIPGFIATGGFDKRVKLWSVTPGVSGPSLVVSRDLDVGRVFSIEFGPDKEVGFRLAVAGSKGIVQVWDTSTNAAVRRAFTGRLPEKGEGGKERLVGVQDDSDDGEGSDEEDERQEDGEGGSESMDE